MFRALSPSAIAEMEELGDIVVTIKEGWESQGGWSAKPANISYWLGQHNETVFTCYYSRDNGTIQITNVEPTKIIGDKKALVDAYLYVAIKGLIGMADVIKAKRLIVDSFLPQTADHLFDLGFFVTAKGLSSGARGCLTLKRI